MIITTERSTPGLVLDTVLTALGWLCFLYLLAQGILSLMDGEARGPDVPFWTHMLPTLHTLAVYLVVAAVNGALLLSWALYNRARFARADRRKAIPRLHDTALARSFGVSTEQISGLRSTSVAVIHHADDGRIVDIDMLPSKVTWLREPPVLTEQSPEALATV